jgi:hypothetical protein
MGYVMSIWIWVAVGIGAFLALGLLTAIAVAAVLGRIAEDISSLLEHEEWTTAPMTQEKAVSDELTVRRTARAARARQIRK